MSTQEYERQWAYIGDTTYRETEDELVMRLGALSYGAPKVHRILDSFVLATDSPVLRLRTIEVEGRSFARSYEATVIVFLALFCGIGFTIKRGRRAQGSRAPLC